MANWISVRRVIIITDTAIESPNLEHLMSIGVRGYNCVYCFGKGRHESMEDPFTGRSQVRIEVLASQSIAEKVMDYIHEPEFARYPIIAFSDTVEIDERNASYF